MANRLRPIGKEGCRKCQELTLEKEQSLPKCYWGNLISTCRRIKELFTSYSKISSRWTKDSDRKPGTEKLLGENKEEKFQAIGMGNGNFRHKSKGIDNKSKNRRKGNV